MGTYLMLRNFFLVSRDFPFFGIKAPKKKRLIMHDADLVSTFFNREEKQGSRKFGGHFRVSFPFPSIVATVVFVGIRKEDDVTNGP